MASEVDICNLALGNIGDSATVSSISPPEGSVQAEHCARFYPVARDALLTMHMWGFATRRAHLTPLSEVPPGWAFAYAKPSLALEVRDVYPSEDQTPQEFICESAEDGSEHILTNQELAQARYVARIEDTSKFSPLFTEGLGWLLASMLAGPIIKGDSGRAEAKRCKDELRQVLVRALISDSRQGMLVLDDTPTAITARS